MIKSIYKILFLGILLVAVVVLTLVWDEIKGILPSVQKPPADITDVIDEQNNVPGQNATGFALTVPENFKIEVLAPNLPGARVMAIDERGSMWVSQTSRGTVTQLEFEDGKIIRQNEVFKNLNGPHGLAIDWADGTTLYIAEEDKISRVPLYSDAPLEKIADLPSGGGHSTRTIEFGPDGLLYVSIGSSCNVCDETDERRAAIYVMNKDGSNFRKFASGLRNSVFFDWSFVDGQMWATDNSRDLLGDDVPPDEINIIKEGGNYGWPVCYGKNIHDTNFDKKTYIRNPCSEPFEQPSKVDIQAHSPALGLGFVPEEGWPEEYWYDLIVALHGSWNRTEPTGYKLIRVKLNAQGNYQGTEDFITGWLTDQGVLGRPVDVLVQSGSTMYVSDDKAGVIYQISSTQEQ